MLSFFIPSPPWVYYSIKVAENQCGALYVIRNLLRNVIHCRWNGINPKEKYTLTRDAIRLRRLHSHLRRDYMPILRIG